MLDRHHMEVNIDPPFLVRIYNGRGLAERDLRVDGPVDEVCWSRGEAPDFDLKADAELLW